MLRPRACKPFKPQQSFIMSINKNESQTQGVEVPRVEGARNTALNNQKNIEPGKPMPDLSRVLETERQNLLSLQGFEGVQLPNNIATVIKDIADKYKNCSLSLIYNYLFGAVSTAIGDKAQFAGKYFNYATDYFINVASAGVGKSILSNLFFSEAIDTAKSRREAFISELREYEANKKKDGTKRPKECSGYTTDSTPEKIQQMLQGFNLLYYADEAQTLFNSYTTGIDNSNLFCQLHNQKETFVNRVSNGMNGDTGGVYIEKSLLTIVGNIQTERLNTIFDKNRINGGLISRCLFSFTDRKELEPVTAIELFSTERTDADANTKKCLFDILRAIRNTEAQAIYKADTDAGQTLANAVNNYIGKYNEATIGAVQQYYQRAQIHLLRLALMFAVLRNTCNGTNDKTVNKTDAQNAVCCMDEYLQIFETQIFGRVDIETEANSRKMSNSAIAKLFGETFNLTPYKLSPLTGLSIEAIRKAKIQ